MKSKLFDGVHKYMADHYIECGLSESEILVIVGNRLGIDATPTMFVNGEKVLGVKPYYELKKILIKHGAKRK